MQYRAEIDGLRTIAVIPVILFHLNWSVISGGYIGVDIFFVISGFLITSILDQEIRSGRYSIWLFYERRAKRILPALFAVIIFTLIAFAFLFDALDYKDVGQSAFAALFFSSNILFWSESGYFETAAELKPLLHTWSLGIEEQFYIFFPILLFFSFKYFKKHQNLFFCILFFISFCVSCWGAYYAKDSTFYLIHTRAWELGIGSLLALNLHRFDLRLMTRILLSLLGLALMIVPMFIYDKTSTIFPGLTALPPCLGTALIILSTAGAANHPVKSILSLSPIVYIGKLSYSLYLWHWPLIVIARYIAPSFENYLLHAVVVMLTFGASILSRQFIELPFMRTPKTPQSRKKLFISLSIPTIIIATSSVIIHLNHGFPSRQAEWADLSSEARDDRHPMSKSCHSRSPDVVLNDGLCVIGKRNEQGPHFILWGDSHANQLFAPLEKQALQNNQWGYHASYTSCGPFSNMTFITHPDVAKCLAFIDNVIQLISQEKIKNIVMAAKWPAYTNEATLIKTAASNSAESQDLNFTHLFGSFGRTIDLVNQDRPNIWIVGPIPQYPFSVPQKIALYKTYGIPLSILDLPEKDYLSLNADILTFLQNLTRQNNIHLIDLASILCEDGICPVTDNGRIKYYDDHHITASTALTAKHLFAPIFEAKAD